MQIEGVYLRLLKGIGGESNRYWFEGAKLQLLPSNVLNTFRALPCAFVSSHLFCNGSAHEGSVNILLFSLI